MMLSVGDACINRRFRLFMDDSNLYDVVRGGHAPHFAVPSLGGVVIGRFSLPARGMVQMLGTSGAKMLSCVCVPFSRLRFGF
jgi:hypothetical protein